MAEVVTSSLMKLLFDKLASSLLTEFGLLMGVDKQLGKLESTLLTLHEVLEDAETRQVKEKALKGWLGKLKHVAYDADDVLDEFTSEAVKWRMEIERYKKGKVRSLITKLNSLVLRHEIAHRIKEIRERLDEIAEERSKFHLREGVVEKSGEIGAREWTSSFVNESEVYGREIDKEKIIDFLINTPSESDLGIISVVGLGGLGKTTVAQLVYNDERAIDHFERRMWVCVSDDFDTRRLIRLMIESLTGKECNLFGMDSIQCSLREQLKAKRFLLVLDDVWNENHEKWDGLRNVLSCGANGSKIIVTTRSERVASLMVTTAPHFLTCLSEKDCWALFERRAFGLGGAEKNPNLVCIGKEIVKKCEGIPLAAKALGSLMRFKRGESEWLAVKDNEIWELSDDENQILSALRLSYNHLPSRLKQCFAYCSIFPKGHDVRTEKLVQLWAAEGFIQSSDAGYQFVNELLSRSLFQNGNEDTDGVVRQVRMHDLVHDLAQSVAGDECSIVEAGKRKVISHSLRYSSFLCNMGISEILEPLNQAKKLRTFHLIPWKGVEEDQDKMQELLHLTFSSIKLLRALDISNSPLKFLSDSIKKLKHLRYLNLSSTHLETLPQCMGMLHSLQTLNLSYCRQLRALPNTIGDLHNLSTLDLEDCQNIHSLPDSIGCLTSLRKLNLSHCKFIQALPESVSCLSNLQKFELRYCYMLRQLPDNIKNMKSLIHLDLHSCCGLNYMPAGIGQLSQLRTLFRYVLGGKNSSSLEDLGGLNLEGQLSIKNLQNVRDATEASGVNMNQKQRLRSLELEWDLNAYRNSSRGRNDTDSLEHLLESPTMQDWNAKADLVEDVIECLQPHLDLKALTIENYVGRKFPRWAMELSLPNLVEVSLTSCVWCERLPPFGQLPHLKVLKLSMLPAVELLDSTFDCGSRAFPLLEELGLASMPALKEWSRANEGEVFPCLSKLSLHGCPKLKGLPSSFPSVENLSMDVDDVMLLSSLQNGTFPNLKSLDIGNCDGGDDIPEVLEERMATVQCWTMRQKLIPGEHDSSIMSEFGFGSVAITGGTSSVTIYI